MRMSEYERITRRQDRIMLAGICVLMALLGAASFAVAWMMG